MKELKDYRNVEMYIGGQKLELSTREAYWEEKGKYQNQYNDLWANLVPAHGKAMTENGELIRSASRLYYEYFNNGNINARDIERGRGWYEDDDEDDYTTSVSVHYRSFMRFIEGYIQIHQNEIDATAREFANELLCTIEMIILDEWDTPQDERAIAYDWLADFTTLCAMTIKNHQL